MEAWPSVTRRVPGAQLVLMGDGPDRKALEATNDEYVLFAGHRDDIPDWLAAADVVAVPSRRDGIVPRDAGGHGVQSERGRVRRGGCS